ncbi:DUF3445 domain-containing protein [Horticoccus luteus]|uniref:DUF3445 domain-containing protein n=1 Tax=Horticoccus luteus TaxID=2862869 RepID=A0A8F9TVL9_9BACT|nr:heme-dependent oxidative N-demethylase subunit alpha family protein [Horticoccus luteus]QYM78407.1 DUF3445 domain-containing protein [Horticoccus luteus]
MVALAELFPAGDFRFHLTLRRGAPAEFFGLQDASGERLRERRRWLAEDPARYAALTAAGAVVLAEFAANAVEWRLPRPDAAEDIVAWGASAEPDLLFLRADAAGRFRLEGGALCFPTGWALQEKMGRTLDEIHGVVPGLNAALASPIQQFLQRLKPGVAWRRANWGLAATAELNLHPARAVPAPALPVRLDALWLRVEEQALVALPRSGGIVFGIRIALHRLDHVTAEPTVRAGLRRALETMPDDLAIYKRIEPIRAALTCAL